MSPPVIEGKDGEGEAVLEAAKLMLAAARTAPKTAGVDDILTLIVYGEEKEAIADKMEEMAEERKIEGVQTRCKECQGLLCGGSDCCPGGQKCWFGLWRLRLRRVPRV